MLSTMRNKCYVSKNEYVRAIALTEYQTAKSTYEIAKQCVDKGHWHPSLRLLEMEFEKIKAPWTSFDNYFKFQKEARQTDLYYQQWENTCSFE